MEARTCLSLPLTAGSMPRSSLLLGPQERKGLSGFSRRCWKEGRESISCWVLMSQLVPSRCCLITASRVHGARGSPAWVSLFLGLPILSAHLSRQTALGDTTCAAAFVWEMSSGCQESRADDGLSSEHETGEEISSGTLTCSCL